MSATTDYGHSFSISLFDSTPTRVDNLENKMLTLYQPPSITGIQLDARAYLVNGTYSRYMETEYVIINVDNPNNVEMAGVPVLCKTHIHSDILNSTWVDADTLICRTHLALNIDNF